MNVLFYKESWDHGGMVNKAALGRKIQAAFVTPYAVLKLNETVSFTNFNLKILAITWVGLRGNSWRIHEL
jgi:hypothetical protein